MPLCIDTQLIAFHPGRAQIENTTDRNSKMMRTGCQALNSMFEKMDD